MERLTRFVLRHRWPVVAALSAIFAAASAVASTGLSGLLTNRFGKWNWWLPCGLARLVRVEASPLDDRPTRGDGVREPPLRRG